MNIIHAFCEGKSYLKQNQQLVFKKEQISATFIILDNIQKTKKYHLNNEHSLHGKCNVTMVMTYFSDS